MKITLRVSHQLSDNSSFLFLYSLPVLPRSWISDLWYKNSLSLLLVFIHVRSSKNMNQFEKRSHISRKPLWCPLKQFHHTHYVHIHIYSCIFVYIRKYSYIFAFILIHSWSSYLFVLLHSFSFGHHETPKERKTWMYHHFQFLDRSEINDLVGWITVWNESGIENKNER